MPISTLNKPLIAVTLGDPAGIGPELIVKSLSSRVLRRSAYFFVIGDYRIIQRASRRLNCKTQFKRINDVCSVKLLKNYVGVLDLANADPAKIKTGILSTASGRASAEYIFRAIELANKKLISAVVTAPISKEAINTAGFKYSGHTEILAAKTASRVRMMLVGGALKVVLVTTHLPLKKVASSLTEEQVFETIQTADTYLKKYFRINSPTIAVCGLNPHAGDNGVLGDEEQKIITPAIKQAKALKINVVGPMAADSLFYKAYHKEFDAVIAMYHDQGLVPLKMLAFDKGVNITLGLPFVRTSPDHGTAFNIASRFIASANSMNEALKLAVRLCRYVKAKNL